jgi:integration host factor subunit beta
MPCSCPAGEGTLHARAARTRCDARPCSEPSVLHDLKRFLDAASYFGWNKVAMTKADLIEEVSRVVEMTRKEAEVIVEAIFDSIVRALRSGDKIEIRGFGSFRTRQRQPRVGRNPKTGARVEVPAKKIPYFKPSKELKDIVNASAPAATPGLQPTSDSVPS